MKTLHSVRLPAEIVPAVERAAKRECRTKNNLIVVAVRDYLRRQGHLPDDVEDAEQPTKAA
jgi:predicted transcriptional regulator